MNIRAPVLVSRRTMFAVILAGVAGGLVALLLFSLLDHRFEKKPGFSAPSALSRLAGQYAASQSECGMDPKFEVSPNQFKTRADGFAWPSPEYEATGWFTIARSDPTAPSPKKVLVLGASSQADGKTVVSGFMPLTDADMEWWGLAAEKNKSISQRPVIAYFAYAVDGTVNLSDIQPAMDNPEDMTLLITCPS